MRSTIAIAAIAGVAAAAPNYGPPPPVYGEKPSSTPVVSSTPAYTPPGYGEMTSSTPAASSTPAYTPPVYGVPSSSAPVYGVSSSVAYTPKPSSSVPYVTKTVYSTSLVTVTSCGAYVEKCPASSTIVSTVKVPVSTTVCPEDEYPEYTPGPKPSKPVHEKPSKPVVTVVYPPKETPKVPVKESTTCSESVIVTVTLPSKPVHPVYPTGPAPHYPAPPVGTGAYVPPAQGTAAPSGYVKPSAPAYFTGAASHANIGGFVAGVGAFAAFFL